MDSNNTCNLYADVMRAKALLKSENTIAYKQCIRKIVNNIDNYELPDENYHNSPKYIELVLQTIRNNKIKRSNEC